MSTSELHERLGVVAGDRTYRVLGEMTKQNAETVRRYMQGQAPSVDFLTELCRALELNAHWLLTGDGPMRAGDARRHALREAKPQELLAAIANSLEHLTGRVDRIETYVQMLEAHVRGARDRGAPHRSEGTPHGEQSTAQPADGAPAPGPARAADRAGERARRIADAIPERPREDDGGAAPSAHA